MVNKWHYSVQFLFLGEQSQVDELKEAEAELQDGSIIVMQEWKNECQMNFSGELKGLQPNTEYSLWVALEKDSTSDGCPNLSTEPNWELTTVSPNIIDYSVKLKMQIKANAYFYE